MKIAVASEKDQVTAHFGHCENFNIFDTDGKEITAEESVANPGHKPGFLPVFLNDLGVNVVISGGMGKKAVDLFNEKGIQVIIGASGDAKNAVHEFLNGNLETSGEACVH